LFFAGELDLHDGDFGPERGGEEGGAKGERGEQEERGGEDVPPAFQRGIFREGFGGKD